MHLERTPIQERESKPQFISRKSVMILLALVYGLGAILSASTIIAHSKASTQAIEQILVHYNMQNEGARALERFDKDNPFLGLFISSPIRHNFELPSTQQANKALFSDITHLLKTIRLESSTTAWWSWFLLNLSLFYAILVIALERNFFTRSVFFSLTCISLVFFVIGVLAPAMVIWTSPSISMPTGKLEFVLQHEVRGIAAIIHELLTTGHWIVGGFLLLFSIITPLTKASLTFFVTACQSKSLNYRIGQFLHTIGKWSMADVFVAGVLLALYALKAHEATKSIPCLGLYYFIGYCLLSMTTIELLVHSGLVAGNDLVKAEKKLGRWVINGLLTGFLCFVLVSSLYTYQQYTMNMKQEVSASESPQKLNNADLVLPAHQ